MVKIQMRSLALSLFISIALNSWAADTPSNMPNPADTSDLMRQAREAIQQRDWGLSLSLLEQAQSSGLDSDDLHNLLGYSLRMKRPPDVERAIRHYQLALQRNPNHLGAHEYLGEAYLMIDDLPSAQKHLNILRELCVQVACEEYRDLQRAIEIYSKSNRSK